MKAHEHARRSRATAGTRRAAAVDITAAPAPSAARLLDAWEDAAGRSAAQRTLTLLRAAIPAATDAELARLTVGEVDRRLLALRDAAFGTRFDAVSRCPRCQESIELEFRSAEFPVADSAARASDPVQCDGYRVEFRPPTLGDLAEAARAADASAVRAWLLERCITSVRAPGRRASAPASLPTAVIAAVGEALERADPLAATRIELCCPSCAHAWSSVFDVSAYLWAELDGWARGLLREVHLLASAYGWREPDVLALSPRRRREYLDMVLG